ncbi:MAG: hypothetical protein ABIS86_22955 [Streptosporangiaceae bacterium]
MLAEVGLVSGAERDIDLPGAARILCGEHRLAPLADAGGPVRTTSML